MHKLTELGALLLVLAWMGMAAFLYAGPRDHLDEVDIDDYCITTP